MMELLQLNKPKFIPSDMNVQMNRVSQIKHTKT